DNVESFKRIRVMNLVNGMSALSAAHEKGAEKATWLGTLEIPEDVSVEAGKRLLSIAAELDDDSAD
ncbi:MAG: hypothetical protein ACO1PZ_13215, partial [Gammaproteobacteria bacterium]